MWKNVTGSRYGAVVKTVIRLFFQYKEGTS